MRKLSIRKGIENLADGLCDFCDTHILKLTSEDLNPNTPILTNYSWIKNRRAEPSYRILEYAMGSIAIFSMVGGIKEVVDMAHHFEDSLVMIKDFTAELGYLALADILFKASKNFGHNFEVLQNKRNNYNNSPEPID